MKTNQKITPNFSKLILAFSVCYFLYFLFPIVAGADDERVSPLPTVTIPDTNTWSIRLENIFKSDWEPVNPYVSDLLIRLEAKTGFGQSLNRDEFLQLILELEDNIVYTSQLIKYATPISKKIQDDAHANYAVKLMKPDKISAGVEFLRTHRQIFEAAQKAYQIEPKDILSILMWESALGKYTGNYRIFNVFMGQILFLGQAEKVAWHQLKTESDSVALDFPSQEYRLNRLRRNAVKNLAILLRISKEKGTNPLAQLGSWGGAIGYAQFMPASLRFAVDGDANGEIDLTTWPDAIHSVANYLREANYKKDKKGRKRAIFAYNRLDSYVNGVIQYADAAWQQFEAEGGFATVVPDSTMSTLDVHTK